MILMMKKSKEMREATKEEQEYIQKHIDEISVSTGINFWDEFEKKEIVND